MLWDDFLNSDYHDWRGKGNDADRLDDPDWIRDWLATHRITVPAPPDSKELTELKRFRAKLLAAAIEAAGDSLSPELQGWLNDVMAGSEVRRSLVPGSDGGYAIRLEPVRLDWTSIAAEIAASFAGTLAQGGASRIRICDNPDCRWVYLDETRNRSKRYCDDKMCGNLMKVRRFRAKHKAGGHRKDG